MGIKAAANFCGRKFTLFCINLKKIKELILNRII